MEECLSRRPVLKWPLALPNNERSPSMHLPPQKFDSARHRSSEAASSYLPSWNHRSNQACEEASFPKSLVAIISPMRKQAVGDSAAPFGKVPTPRALAPSSLCLGNTTSFDLMSNFQKSEAHANEWFPSNRVGHIQLKQWLVSHGKELNEEAFSSIAVYSELRMRETIERTAGKPRPNRERCAVATDIFFKMSHLFGRFESLMRLVADELVSSTYASMSDRNTGDVPPQRKVIEASVPYFELWNNAKLEVRVLTEKLQASKASGKAQSMQRTTALLAQVSKVDQRMLQNHSFCAWRGYCQEQAVRRFLFQQRATLRCASQWFKNWRGSRHKAYVVVVEEETVTAATCASNAPLSHGYGEDVSMELEYLRNMNGKLVREAAEVCAVLDAHRVETADGAKVLWSKLSELMKTHAGTKHSGRGRQMGAKFGASVGTANILRGLFTSEMGVQTICSGATSMVAKETQTEAIGAPARTTIFSAVSLVHSTNRKSSFSGCDQRRTTILRGNQNEVFVQPKGLGELIESKSKKGSKAKPAKEISIQIANSLIISIYEAKLKQDNDDLIEGRPHQSLPELARDLLIRKYGIKRLATKTMKSLVAMCKKHGSSTARLRLFASLCAIPTNEKSNHERYSVVKVALFSELISRLFKSAKDVGVAMSVHATGGKQLGIDRDVAMAAFASTFTTIRKRNTPEYKQTARALVLLPSEKVVTLVDGSATKQTLVNVDDAIELMMSVWEAEHRLKSASALTTLGTPPGATAGATADGTLERTARQTTLLSNLLSTKLARQRETKRLQEAHLEGEFNAAVGRHNTSEGGNGRGELTLAHFQELLDRLDLRLDNRQVLELFNEWEDQCEAEEEDRCDSTDKEDGGGGLVQAARAAVFASIIIGTGLYKQKESPAM